MFKYFIVLLSFLIGSAFGVFFQKNTYFGGFKEISNFNGKKISVALFYVDQGEVSGEACSIKIDGKTIYHEIDTNKDGIPEEASFVVDDKAVFMLKDKNSDHNFEQRIFDFILDDIPISYVDLNADNKIDMRLMNGESTLASGPWVEVRVNKQWYRRYGQNGKPVIKINDNPVEIEFKNGEWKIIDKS